MKTQENKNYFNLKMKPNQEIETFESREILKLVENLQVQANPKHYIESVNNGHLANIKAQMKDFKLKGKELSSMSFINHSLLAFFYDLDTLCASLKIYGADRVNQEIETFKSREVLKLVNDLLVRANPKHYIESVNNGHLANIEAQMKDFKLKGKELSSMSFINHSLLAFFYGLDRLYGSLKINREIRAIAEV